MCGIAGYLDLTRAASPDALRATARRMADSLAHRGPDSDGVWADAPAGIALGHRRLAIIDLTPEGHQPMTSADGRYVISYNGEVYNFPLLRRELEARGHRFRGRSDTEIILAAIVEWGLQAAVGRFVGMFAFALWDRQERRLHLVRDRLGIKPVYYARTNGHFLFGSELRALQAHPAFSGTIDRDALALYLRRNCVPAPYSIFAEVRKLPPGTILSIGANDPAPELSVYWSLQEVVAAGERAPFHGDEDEAAAELERLLTEAVRCRMIADVPLGVFLSGGIDSSVVAALMQAVSDRPVKSFSIGFREGGYNEAEDAAAVARHLATEHHELYVTPAEAQAVVEKLGSMFDEPFADSSQVPTFLVSQMARRTVTVTLSGDGGDEFFGGYNRYLWCRRILACTGWIPRGTKLALARLMTIVPTEQWDRLDGLLGQRNPGDKLHKLAPLLRAAGAGEIYQGLISHWRDPRAVVIGGDDLDDVARQFDDCTDAESVTRRMMYLDAVTYLPNDILTKVDRASMAVSLETRVPLLDHRVAAFAWSLPQRMKIADGVTKKLLRRVLHAHVPPRLVERPKMGFGIPIGDWLRGPLKDWAAALLDEERLRREGYFQPAPIRRAWKEHLSGRRNWQYQLWDILMFQAWLEAQGT